MSKNETYRPLPSSVTIKDSNIEGLGLFSKEAIVADTILGVSHVILGDQVFRTPLGGFVNHDEYPNCSKHQVNNLWFLKTLRDIEPNEELTLKYTFYKI